MIIRATFDDFILGETARIMPSDKKCNRFRNIIIAITKRCPYQCAHCFEWDALNGTEKLTLSDINTIVGKFQDKGTSQIQLTGGEPMLRANGILEILKSAGSQEFNYCRSCDCAFNMCR